MGHDGQSLRDSAPGDTGRPVSWLAALIHRTGQVMADTKTNEIR